MLGVILGTIGIVVVTVAIGLLMDRKMSLLPRPEDFETDKDKERKRLVSHAAGEAPQTALRVRDPQIAKLRTSQRCAQCRAVMQNEADDTVRYGDADLLVLHFVCPSCAAKRTVYIERVG